MDANPGMEIVPRLRAVSHAVAFFAARRFRAMALA
jgi:hypothetical protein